MDDDSVEGCGRCGITSAVDQIDSPEDYDPFGEESIRVSESDAKKIQLIQIKVTELKRKLDRIGYRVIRGGNSK
ncbi:MAG: hypothetical protein ABEK59_09305 [Halobacteria archaeon]